MGNLPLHQLLSFSASIYPDPGYEPLISHHWVPIFYSLGHCVGGVVRLKHQESTHIKRSARNMNFCTLYKLPICQVYSGSNSNQVSRLQVTNYQMQALFKLSMNFFLQYIYICNRFRHGLLEYTSIIQALFNLSKKPSAEKSSPQMVADQEMLRPKW